MDIENFLNMTIACKDCKGQGTIYSGKIVDGKKEKIKCSICNGSGIVIDNFIPDSIKKYTQINRADLAKCVGEIYKHYSYKIRDAYQRGLADGKVKK